MYEEGCTKYVTKLKFPFRAIVPGQVFYKKKLKLNFLLIYCLNCNLKFAAFYRGEECIGSAKIIKSENSLYDLKSNEKITNTDKMFTKKY
jgi:hypothetical protein